MDQICTIIWANNEKCLLAPANGRAVDRYSNPGVRNGDSNRLPISFSALFSKPSNSGGAGLMPHGPPGSYSYQPGWEGKVQNTTFAKK